EVVNAKQLVAERLEPLLIRMGDLAGDRDESGPGRLVQLGGGCARGEQGGRDERDAEAAGTVEHRGRLRIREGETKSRKSVDLWLGRRRAGMEENEVAALVRLCDMIDSENAVSAPIGCRSRLPSGAAALELRIVHVEM